MDAGENSNILDGRERETAARRYLTRRQQGPAWKRSYCIGQDNSLHTSEIAIRLSHSTAARMVKHESPNVFDMADTQSNTILLLDLFASHFHMPLITVADGNNLGLETLHSHHDSDTCPAWLSNFDGVKVTWLPVLSWAMTKAASLATPLSGLSWLEQAELC